MKKAALPVFVIGSLLLSGCAVVNNLVIPPVKVSEIAKSSDAEKAAAVEKSFRGTLTHDKMQSQKATAEAKSASEIWDAAFSKPKIDFAALKKVKKVAIISFDVNVAAGAPKEGGGSTVYYNMKDPAGKLVNLMYDEMKKALTGQGFEVVSPDAVLSDAAYKTLSLKEEGATLDSAGYAVRASAYGLKDILAWEIVKTKFMDVDQRKIWERTKGKASLVQKAAQSLGVDAVIFVTNNVNLDHSGWTGKVTASFGTPGQTNVSRPSFAVDMLSSVEPKMIWSASTLKPVIVPTNYKSAKGGFLFFGVHEYNLDAINPDILLTYQDIANLVAFKLKHDKEK